MATTADESSPTSTPTLAAPSPPHEQVRTCNLCRQRRVKCDRQFPRCSNCLRSEADCVYPPGRGRAPKRPGRGAGALNPQLSERLSRLESIIKQFGPAARESHQAQETSQVREGSDAHPFNQDFSRLKIDDSQSYYINNALWVTLSNEVEELRDLLFEPASADVGCEPAPSPYPSSVSSAACAVATPPSTHQGLNAAIFGFRAIASSLQSLHPSLPQAVTLFAAFTENVAPLVRIFHMPTLTRDYWDAIASLDSLDKHTEALLFAIHYSAVISLTPEQCVSILDETRETVLERYRFAVEQALARGNLLNTQSLTMLQATVLFLSALPNEDDSRAAWSLTSLIYHIARTMGLHRDGTVFGLKPFETELRRRLWWQICIIDSRSSEYHCNEPIARGFVSDTKPPLHVNDVDLSPDMVEPPAERWDHATDMTLTLVRCEAIQTGWKLGQMKQNQSGLSDSSSTSKPIDEIRVPPNKRWALIQNLEARLRDRYLPICDASVPFQLLSSAVARIIIARFWLITHYSDASRGKDIDNRNHSKPSPVTPYSPGQLDSKMRNELFQTSIGILEVSGMLLTDRRIMQWTWYSKTHIQWGAMAFVLSELCVRPHSPECDRAWDCVTAVYEGWKVRENKDDETRLALWRPIRRLMAKARYVREMQRTDPGQPARSGWATERNRPDPFSLAMGSAIPHYPLSTYTGSSYAASLQSTSSTSIPESLLFGSPSVPSSSESSNALQKVLGTETLGPFMDLLPDWPWTDTDSNTTASLPGFDPGLSPRPF